MDEKVPDQSNALVIEPHVHTPHTIGQMWGAVPPGELLMKRIQIRVCVECWFVYAEPLPDCLPPTR